MIKAHKIRLHPTPDQQIYFAKAAGTARFVWNWALSQWNKQYAEYAAIKEGRASRWPENAEPIQSPSAPSLKKQFNQIKRSQYPWMWEVTKNASDQPFLDLGKAFTAFFKGTARHPKFKSKKRSHPSFYLANDQFEPGDYRIWIPKLGWVNIAEKLRFTGKVTGSRITRSADWWFISITVEIPDPIPLSTDRPGIGIDVGLHRLATLSDGTEFENQKYLKTALKRLRQANTRLHRRKKGSKNREKARRHVARIHYKITCLRDDFLHKLTTKVADQFALIGIENLNLPGLMKNRRLARSFADAALGKLKTFLQQKASIRGGAVLKVGRFFPSSQLCSCCGWRWTDIALTNRIFVCQQCGFQADRDWNAAINILQETLRLLKELQTQGKVVFGSGFDET